MTYKDCSRFLFIRSATLLKPSPNKGTQTFREPYIGSDFFCVARLRHPKDQLIGIPGGDWLHRFPVALKVFEVNVISQGCSFLHTFSWGPLTLARGPGGLCACNPHCQTGVIGGSRVLLG